MKFTAFILLLVTVNAFSAELIEPPMPPSPISEFRGWLKQSPEERKIALARRPEKSRQILEKKIEEYAGLPLEERERRLAASEMQWYLTRLLGMPKPERERALQSVPALWQPMILERLTQWDKMTVEVRSRARNHKLVAEYLTSPADQQRAVLRSLNAQERELLLQRIDEWKILPAVERDRMDERLKDFFNTEPAKQTQTLNSFTEAERQIMRKTLAAFRSLSPEQRALCLQSFATFTRRFAAMKPEERLAFLKNVERWQELTQQERDMWREVVSVVPPMPRLPSPEPPLPGPGPTGPTP